MPATAILLTAFLAGAAPEERRENPPAKRKKVGRAFIEQGLQSAIGTYNYWKKYHLFIEDWQFRLTWKDQTRKWFTSEGLRLDSNNMRLNWTHALSGALYYNYGRTNGFSAAGAALFNFGASLYWEYFAEWREISSINDHIFTTGGGPAIGEPLFQIGSHFRDRPGLANRLGEILFNPVLALNDLLDGKGRPPRVPADDWRDFRLGFGGRHGDVAATADGRNHASIGLDMRLVTLPGYGRAGTGRGYIGHTLASDLRADFVIGHGSVQEYGVRTRAVLLGWWWRNVRLDASRRMHGSEAWLGLASGWHIFKKRAVADYDGNDLGMTMKWFPRERPTRYTEKISSIAFPGPAFSLTRYAGPLAARIDLEAAIAFSMVHSLAYNTYTGLHDPWGVKTTLHNWGYYYAFGPALGAALELRLGPLRAAGEAQYQRFRSVQGLDRYQGDILDDSPLVDSRLLLAAELTAALPRTPLWLGLRLETIDRRGAFHEVRERLNETRFTYRIGLSF